MPAHDGDQPGRDETPWLVVGEVARQCDTTVRTLQFYDRIGLLVADRDQGGRRRYGPDHLSRLRQIQLLTGAGCSLDEVGDALDRQAGLSLLETYREQVRMIEISELRLRCQRSVLTAVTEVLADYPDASVPAEIVVAAMSLDRTLLRHPEVDGPAAGPADAEVDVQRMIDTYFTWKAHAVQALMLVENGVPAESPAGRRLGRERRRAAEQALEGQPEGTGELYRLSEQAHDRWPPGDRILHQKTKEFTDQCIRAAERTDPMKQTPPVPDGGC